MENLIGKYGWVSISQIRTDNFKRFISSRDIENLENLDLKDNIFICIDILQDDYLKLKSTEVEIDLKSEVFRKMPEQPKFKPLEKVKFYNTKGFLEFGIIKGIHWHDKDHKMFYDVEVNGKLKGRRYFDEDLERNEI